MKSHEKETNYKSFDLLKYLHWTTEKTSLTNSHSNNANIPPLFTKIPTILLYTMWIMWVATRLSVSCEIQCCQQKTGVQVAQQLLRMQSGQSQNVCKTTKTNQHMPSTCGLCGWGITLGSARTTSGEPS